MPGAWHQDMRCAGEGRYLAELYLVHWGNLWTSRAGRPKVSGFPAGAATNVSWFGRHVDMPSFPVNVVARGDEDWFGDLPEPLRRVGSYPGPS
jgi:hypothetical protein